MCKKKQGSRGAGEQGAGSREQGAGGRGQGEQALPLCLCGKNIFCQANKG